MFRPCLPLTRPAALLAAGAALMLLPAAGLAAEQTEAAEGTESATALEADPFADEEDDDAGLVDYDKRRQADDFEDDVEEFAPLDLPEGIADVEVIEIRGARREASAQSEAIAISTFSQSALDKLGVTNVETLQSNVPSLHIGQQGNQAIITLRGVGVANLTISGEPGVQFYVDGVPLGRTSAANAAFFDLAGLDVLRGPQGTQGGRHSAAGRISLRSAPPTPEFAANGDFQRGTYDQYVWRGWVNTPLWDDSLMSRFSFVYERRDGYQRAAGARWPCRWSPRCHDVPLTTGGAVFDPRPPATFRFLNDVATPLNRSHDAGDADNLAIRGQLKSVVTDNWETRAIVRYNYQKNNGFPGHLLSGVRDFGNQDRTRGYFGFPDQVSTDPRVSLRDEPGFSDNSQLGVTAISEWTFEQALLGEVKNTTTFSYQKLETDFLADLDQTPRDNLTFQQKSKTGQYTAEIKFENVEQKPWQWLAGFFWYQEDTEQNSIASIDGDTNFALNTRFNSLLLVDSFAGYGELSYWFADSARFLVGLRYARDTKFVRQNQIFDFGGTLNPIVLQETWPALTPRFQLEWEVTDSSRLVASVTNGFKAGGFPTGSDCANSGDPSSMFCASYDAERVWNYEFTSKNQLFDDRLQLNVTLFWTDYDPYQTCFITGFQFRCFTTGRANIRGIELEFRANPTPDLLIDGNINVLDSEVQDLLIPDPELATNDPLRNVAQDVSGNPLPRAPQWNVNVGIQYDIHTSEVGLPEWGTFTPRFQFQWQSRTFYRVWARPEFSQPAYAKIDARVTWRSNDDRWKIEGFVNNITDVDVINNLLLFQEQLSAAYLAPRTAGVRIGFDY